MQDLPTWSKPDDEKEGEQPRTMGQELVDDFKTAGTTVTEMTISNTLRRSGLKSYRGHKVPLHKKAYVLACLKFANKHLDDSEEAWKKVVRLKLSFLASTRLAVFGGKKLTWTQEHYPNH